MDWPWPSSPAGCLKLIGGDGGGELSGWVNWRRAPSSNLRLQQQGEQLEKNYLSSGHKED